MNVVVYEDNNVTKLSRTRFRSIPNAAVLLHNARRCVLA